MQIGEDLQGREDDYQGDTVSLDASGLRVAAGAPGSLGNTASITGVRGDDAGRIRV